ncbi:MAG: aspartyl/asparaginyl beta-hydroxylase domain-containing protein, partial [Deltaproteobacteria bacterium]|nr:aspartyl/asparaginyl beta-hydroxylase domain-containing protein [Deltaproteobacteria bacterium]
YLLFAMGQKAEGNCGRCPETTRVLESIPGMTTAFFSILAPGKHIPPDRGIFKGFVRCHLGLLVPERRADCYMRVADVNLHWEPGKCMVFDDTYDHEVHNDTDERRVVLLIDVVRPIRYPARLLTRGLMWMGNWTAYIKDARRNESRVRARPTFTKRRWRSASVVPTGDPLRVAGAASPGSDKC